MSFRLVILCSAVVTDQRQWGDYRLLRTTDSTYGGSNVCHPL